MKNILKVIIIIFGIVLNIGFYSIIGSVANEDTVFGLFIGAIFCIAFPISLYEYVTNFKYVSRKQQKLNRETKKREHIQHGIERIKSKKEKREMKREIITIK